MRSLYTRRLWMQGLAVGAAPVMAAPDASERLLPSSQDLRRELQAALARQEPLVVMASLHGCPYCKLVRENFLLPLSQSGACITQIHFLSRDPLRNWAGEQSTHGAVIRQLGIELAPSLLFYGAAQQEVAARLVGGSIPDFYGAYLDERMAAARAALRSR